MKTRFTLLFGICLFLTIGINAQVGIFVDSSAVGANDGTSWSDAYLEFSMALDSASSGDTIFIARGTYKPDTTGLLNHRDATFGIFDTLTVLGCYPSGGGGFGSRNLISNPTILSGDIGVNDDSTDNAFHVVAVVAADMVRLDMLIVEKGQAEGSSSNTINGESLKREDGAGVYVHESNVFLKQVVMKKNTNLGGGDGGGFFMSDAQTEQSVVLNSCRMEDNSSWQGAGGYFYGAYPNNVEMRDCVIKDNYSRSYGGAFKFHAASRDLEIYMEDCMVIGNIGTRRGGFAANFTNSPSGSLVLEMVNCEVYDNYSTEDGGIMRNDCSGDCFIDIYNCTFVSNASADGDLFYNVNSNDQMEVYVTNSIFWDQDTNLIRDIFAPDVFQLTNTALPNDVFPVEAQDGGGNFLDVDPEFQDEANDDFRLDVCSPMVNAGVNDSIPAGITEDIAGNPRLVGSSVDLGAYESQAAGLIQSALFVDESGGGDGSSWASAMVSLDSALAAASACSIIDTIFIAEGTYLPGDVNFGFAMPGGVILMGGYPNGGGVRDIDANPTILSGDVNVMGDPVDNSLHVINIGPDITGLVIDGCTISDGYADGMITLHQSGSAILCYGSLTLRNVIVEDNYSDELGPIIVSGADGSISLERCTIQNNTTSDGSVLTTEIPAQWTIDDDTTIEP